jgi:hypothetical protein
MTTNLGPGAIVGWLRLHGTDNNLAGCAFLVSPDVVLTCAHVIGAHLGLGNPVPPKRPTGAVTIRFESLQAEVTGRVLPGGWFSNARPRPGDLSDIAVLRLDKPVLAISSLPAIARRMPTHTHAVLIHGAESNYKSYGQQVSGEMGGSNMSRGWRQIDPTNSARGFTVRNGFSGSPVLDDLGNVVWGMIVTIAEPDSGVAFAITAEDLLTALKRAGAESAVHLDDREQLAMKSMSEVLEHIRKNAFAEGRKKLLKLENSSAILSEPLRARIAYNRACLAETLDEALDYLTRWLKIGLDDAWKIEGKTPQNEIYRMGSDSDLRCLLDMRRDMVLQRIPKAYHKSLPRSLPVKRRYTPGGGCVPGNAVIHTPSGPRAVVRLREGHQVISFELGNNVSLVTTRIMRIHASRASKCVRLNEHLCFTLSQPLYDETGRRICAGDVEVGMKLLACSPDPILIRSKSVVSGYYEVYNLTTDHETHNYAAYDGILCHNKAE